MQRVAPAVHASPFDGHAAITQAQAELHQLFRAGRLAAAGEGHEVVTWAALRAAVPALVSDAALLAALPSTGAHLSPDRTLVLGIALGDLDEEGMGNAVTHLSFEYD